MVDRPTFLLTSIREGIVFCSVCGSSVDDDHNYCAYCGQQLSSQQDPIERELIDLFFFPVDTNMK